MNFLQPALLFGLPLIALPIIIHLVYRRRYRVVEWGAMMFLLAGSRMSKGWQQIRHWIILALRVLAVAGLVFALSRPLGGGWIGAAAGGRPDTVIVVLDRSASMQARDAGGTTSRIERGVTKIVEALGVIDAGRYVLVDSTRGDVRDLDRADALLDLPAAKPTDTHADMPALLQTTVDYMVENETGRTEVWVCSDAQSGDWDLDSGRWSAFRSGVSELEQPVRFHLLALSEPPPANLAVRVTEVRRVVGDAGPELLLDLHVRRTDGQDHDGQVLLSVVVAGARTSVTVDVQGTEARLDDHRVPLDPGTKVEWGQVELPSDSNPADNVYYFVMTEEPPRRTVIVAEHAASGDVLAIAARAPVRPGIDYDVTTKAPDEIVTVDLEDVGLVLWQGSLPNGALAADLEALVARGGRVVFFPPAETDAGSFAGLSWGRWTETPDDRGFATPTTWRESSDLLADVASGRALPVGDLRVTRGRTIEGDGTTLARLDTGVPFLVRATTTTGGVYFVASMPSEEMSNLATDGVVLVAMVHRALDEGSRSLRATGQRDAGAELTFLDRRRVMHLEDAPRLSTERNLHAGVLEFEGEWIALNRPIAEDVAPTAAPRDIDRAFAGLDYRRVTDDGKSDGALVEEIWRIFLILVVVALLVEAVLCLVDQKDERRSDDDHEDGRVGATT